MFLVKLPLWKAYLYSLMERIRIYYAINTGTYNFGFNLKEKRLLKRMFKKYLGTQKGGGYRDIKSVRYLKLINSVRKNQVIASQNELELVTKLSIVTKLNLEDLMNFEIKQLKELAGEVGINALAAAKMKPEDLAKEIIKAVDPKKGYSTEFVKWYDAIPDEFLNTIESTSASSSSESTDIDLNEVISTINEMTKMGELKELVKELGSLFEGFDINKHKLAGPCKKALVEFLSKPKSSSSKSAEPDDDVALKQEVATAINATKSEDELIAVIEENNELFTDFNTEESNWENLKKLLINHLGIKMEAPTVKESLKDKLKRKKAEAEKAEAAAPPEGMVIDFDPNPGKFDAEKVYEKADGLRIGELKKFYSQLSKITKVEMASNKPGISKESLMEGIANALTDLAENGPKEGAPVCECAPATEAESEITRKLVEDAAKAEDKEALQAMCEQLGIALNPLEKRNVSRMKDKLIAKLPEEKAVPKRSGLALLKSKSDTVKETPPAPAEESKLVSIFSTVEKMVLAEAEEKDIIAEVTPMYKEMGVSALVVRKRVKILIEVIQVEHGLKK